MILRDPVHGLVSFAGPDEGLVTRLLDTAEVQRLRRVRMLGVTHLAFPGAEHSRFSHAVGSAFVMQGFLERMRSLMAELSASAGLGSEDVQAALAAALCHDLGHGPLSHLFEEVFEAAPPHEHWTSALLLDPATEVCRRLQEVDASFPRRVERLVHGEHELPWLAHAVSGTFDVDRCDYLLRDSYMTGVRYGLYDLDWLLQSLRLAPDAAGRLGLAVDGSKGLPAVEGFFLARLFMYQQVYFHKAARAAEWLIRAAFRRAAELVRDGGDAALPPVLLAMARGRPVDAVSYCSLDDGTLWATIEAWEASKDVILRDLAARIRRRRLFKTATLEDEDAEGAAELLADVQKCVAGLGFDPSYYTALDEAEVVPYEESGGAEEALRVVYQHRPPRPLSRASFLLGRLAGERLTRRRLVFPPEARGQVEDVLRARGVGWYRRSPGHEDVAGGPRSP